MNHRYYYSLPKYEEVFSYKNLYEAARKCYCGVSWKSLTQDAILSTFRLVYSLYLQLANRTYKTSKYVDFSIYERGKVSKIKAPAFIDRIVQKCLCDNYLVPLLSNGLIYDNPATIKNKGVFFALKRFKRHLVEFNKINQGKGYILIFDFTNYFMSIDHEILYKRIDPKIKDEDSKSIIHQFIDDFGDTGLGLGSQVSQICAVDFLSALDHKIKDYYGVRGYGRYMDDGYLILKTMKEVIEFKRVILEVAEDLKLSISDRKLRIIPIKNSITYLKHRFKFHKNHIVTKSNRKSTTRIRRKLKKLAKLRVPLNRIRAIYVSKRGELEKFNNYKTLINLKELYEQIVQSYRNEVIL